MTDQDGLPIPQRYLSLMTIWFAMTLAVLDGAIANVALPTIAHQLGSPAAEAIWIVNAYQLTVVVSLLPMAAIGEMLGYRRVFLFGVALFTAGSLACAVAESLPVLVAARAFQGIGAAGIMSQNGALLRFTFPSKMLGRAVGLNALVVSAGAALGPTIASGVLALGPWEWLFAINVPLGIVTLLIGGESLPDNPKSGTFDLVGTVLNVLMFGLGFVGLDLLTRNESIWAGSGMLIAGAVAGTALVRRSLSQPRPLVPFDLLRNPVFSLSVATSVASFAAQMLAFVSLPFFFEGILHRGQVETGLLMTPWPVAVGIGAPIAGRLADSVSAAILGSSGLVVLSIGLALLAMLPGDASSFAICWRMAVCGLGFGFFQAPNNRTMLSSAPRDRTGAAGGMLATARLSGQTIGATLAAIAFRLVANPEPLALSTAATLAGLAAIFSAGRLGRMRPKQQPELQSIVDVR
ncbi:MAG: transporter [Tardiphaga sp.]|jgi:DHA2 family multidrug resistance protein-like MFS transporter|nr:transporter [Tardiphaga sp.]